MRIFVFHFFTNQREEEKVRPSILILHFCIFFNAKVGVLNVQRCKTTICFNHPLEFYFTNNLINYFNHPIDSLEYESKICDFGKNIIWLLIIYLIYKSYYNVSNNINNFIILITFILSLLNLNALVYLIPYFLYEFIYN